MKKSLFILASAALVLASCNNDVAIDENTTLVGSNELKEIAFTPFAQKAKRAISNDKHGYINGTTFETTWGMTVSAVDVTKSDASFFNATNFVYNSTATLWNGEDGNHRYWPLSPIQVNFLAIAHANSDNSTDVTWNATNAAHNVQVVMADNYAYNTAQRDFIYAIGNGQVTQNGNALSFPAKVDMTFKHTQSYLVFNLKAADEASTAITITNVEMKGVYTSGTATIARHNPATYADAAVDLTWASRGGTASSAYESVTAAQTEISNALTTSFVERGHLMVVPNMATANTPADNGTTMLKISYTLNGNAYTYEYEIAEDTYDAGKKYIYNITFKLHEIMIDPVVTDWDTDINENNIVDDDVNIYIPSVAYNESGANVSIGHTAGTYTFTISGVPANGGSTYSFVEADAASDNLDFIDGDVTIVEDNTTSAGGYITLKFKSTGGDDGKKHLLKLKLGDTEKMTITLNLSSTALDN